MADYFALMLISVAVAFGGDKLTLGSEYRNKHRRLIICSLIIFILLAGFAGLRTRCNDTGTYKHGYELISPEQGYDDIAWDIGSNPLFNVVNIWLKTGGVSTQNFLMFWALVTVGCYIIFVHKYSSDYAISIFLLYNRLLWLCIRWNKASGGRRHSAYWCYVCTEEKVGFVCGLYCNCDAYTPVFAHVLNSTVHAVRTMW